MASNRKRKSEYAKMQAAFTDLGGPVGVARGGPH